MCQKVEHKIFQNYTAETKVQDVCTFMKNTNISYEKCKIRDILRSHASHLIKEISREVCFFALFSDFNSIFSSVASNIKLLDTRSFQLGKLCVHACSKFESVIFCALILAQSLNQVLENTRRTFESYKEKICLKTSEQIIRTTHFLPTPE